MNNDLIVDGEAMAEIDGHIDVTHLVGVEVSDAAFLKWRDTFPEKHWSKTDLGACRLGWDAGRAELERSVRIDVIDLQQDPQRRAFQAYKVAFNANATGPNLKHAAGLVIAWNAFADTMGLERV